MYGHLRERYGAFNVARVGAITKLTAKSAIRKVLSIYGFSQKEIAKIIGMCPKTISFTFEEALKNKQLKDWFSNHSNLLPIIFKLENKIDHFSTHAGGVVIFPDLDKRLPILRDSKDPDKMIIGLDKDTLEKLGYHKFDILGLNTLNLLDMTLDLINEDIDLISIDYEDENVYNMISSGDVLGVFQLSEQAAAVIEQQPKCFEDLIAINALIRPGVGDWNEYIRRRNNGFDRDNLPRYLHTTSGIIVYQEQYLLLANTYAGWDITYSDKHIRKNKNIYGDVELKAKFINDSIQNGHDMSVAEKIWEDICETVDGGYGFNKAHSASYSRLSYQTAWLKHYYPREFYSALLTTEIGNKTAMSQIKTSLDKMDIKLYPPDINLSSEKFIPYKNGIIYALSDINGVGASAMTEIRRLQPISDLQDFIERRVPRLVRINTIENLIKAGCFDKGGKTRYEMLKQLSSSISKDIQVEEKPDYEYEKESLGIYLFETPYDRYSTPDMGEIKDGTIFSNIGSVIECVVIFDKRGNEMAFVNMENKSGIFRVVVFSSMWSKYKELFTTSEEEHDIILVRGKKDKDSMLLNSAEELE